MSSLTTLRPTTDDTPPPRSRRARVVMVVAGALVLAVVVTWLVAFSPVLGVGGVAVRGTHLLSAREVRRVADVAENTPLVRVDTTAISRRVESLPEVASAQVSTSFPSTVEITVVERTAVGYLREGDHDELVDRTGFRYRSVAKTPAGLPRLVITDGAGSSRTRAEVAVVAASLPASLLARVQSVQGFDAQAITLVLRDDKVVRWGSAARSADKARILGALLSRKGRQIDVTDPDQPFTH